VRVALPNKKSIITIFRHVDAWPFLSTTEALSVMLPFAFFIARAFVDDAILFGLRFIWHNFNL